MKTLSPSQKSDIAVKELVNGLIGIKYLFPDLKVGIVIPAFNEELNIGNTLERIPTNISDRMEIVVVDDGSVDNTYKVARCFDVNIIRHLNNRGNGAATKTGLRFCKEREFDIAIILDGDGQHDPKYIQNFIRPIVEDNIDFTIGNRFKYYYKMNPYRKLCSKLISVFYLLILRKKISDPTNGYRALSSKIFNRIEFQSDYSLTQEMLFKIIPKYNYKEIPLKVGQREHGQSFIKLKNYLKKIIFYFIKYYIYVKFKRITHKLFSKETRDHMEKIFRT